MERDRASGTPRAPSCGLGWARARRPFWATVVTGGVGTPASTEGWRSLFPRLSRGEAGSSQRPAVGRGLRTGRNAPSDASSDLCVRQEVHAVIPREGLSALRRGIGIVTLARSRFDDGRLLTFFSCATVPRLMSHRMIRWKENKRKRTEFENLEARAAEGVSPLVVCTRLGIGRVCRF